LTGQTLAYQRPGRPEAEILDKTMNKKALAICILVGIAFGGSVGVVAARHDMTSATEQTQQRVKDFKNGVLFGCSHSPTSAVTDPAHLASACKQLAEESAR